MSRHIKGHIDEQGCCSCDCRNCSDRDGNCICTDCDTVACGMHQPEPKR